MKIWKKYREWKNISILILRTYFPKIRKDPRQGKMTDFCDDCLCACCFNQRSGPEDRNF